MRIFIIRRWREIINFNVKIHNFISFSSRQTQLNNCDDDWSNYESCDSKLCNDSASHNESSLTD